MNIEMLGSKILREKAKAVDLPLSNENEALVQKMIKHIDDSQIEGTKLRGGIGVAAPQLGVSLRMLYINVPATDDEETFKTFLINPIIIGESPTYAALEGGEGCLSVELDADKTQGLVHRKFKIIIEGYSYFEKKVVRITKTGYHAIVIQHEFDHLEGKVFVDRINHKDVWAKKENEILI